MADTFVISAEVSVGSASETPTIFFKNPSGSGIKIVFGLHLVGTDSFTSGLTLSTLPGTFIHRIYENPTTTANGTALTPFAGFVTASPPTAQLQIFKNPTVTANGNRIWASVETGASEERNLEEGVVLDQNNTLLITCTPVNPTSLNARYYFQWKEIS